MPKLQNNVIAIGDCAPHHDAKYYKTALRVRLCVAVCELLTALLALELAPSEEEIPKYVRSTQYQFRVFKNVFRFMSLRRRYLDKAVML